ncbi:Ectonucleoside triphosphate diphosphohydrolase 1 [Auxenochlorella protothecoides]|uniref:Ectonucleoside triphosphate diphosphohydrolase 1 n=1 Tax=Auxenochlorella protothecoides TaxID=3075 RepID=A0A087SJM9_AUXPR|nr:Ectonucleoside triphosphate diphosphohydrolase 1 [Auxenochlorella protothecoides]KFM25933.1 Ectonucleoside triphosphate diphosphohydrolase 1 [Auxenochlorella protothecoides]
MGRCPSSVVVACKTPWLHSDASEQMGLAGAAPAPRSFPRVLLLGLLALLLAGGGLLLWLRSPPAPRYVLVIDAGSSGTRLHAYEWRASPGAASAPRVRAIPPSAAAALVPRRAKAARRAYQRVETEPALDAWLGDPAGLAAAALGPLLAWAEAVVPARARGATPLFLAGTAGVRRLAEADQAALLGDARRVLAVSGFLFQPGWASTISGQEEGVYGWVALNYEEQRLAHSATLPTLGSLDLGGSSLEVCFEAEPEAMPPPSRVAIQVLGRSYSLFCHVHHGFGLNDAFSRSAASAVEVLHPCLPAGYASPRPVAHREPGVPTRALRLLGAPDWPACVRLAAGVATRGNASSCAAPPCALGSPQPRPRAGQEFVALSGFYVVHHFFGLGVEEGPAALEGAGRAFCATPWRASAARHADELLVEHYCFRAPYVRALLRRGLGLEDRAVHGLRGRWLWARAALRVDGKGVVRVDGKGGHASTGGGPPPDPAAWEMRKHRALSMPCMLLREDLGPPGTDPTGPRPSASREAELGLELDVGQPSPSTEYETNHCLPGRGQSLIARRGA